MKPILEGMPHTLTPNTSHHSPHTIIITWVVNSPGRIAKSSQRAGKDSDT